MNERLAAIASLVLLAASVVLAVVVGVQQFPRGLSVLACVLAAAPAAWWALTHRGPARAAGVAVAGLLLVGAVVLVVTEGGVLENALILVGLLLSVEAARRAFVVHVKLPTAIAAEAAVLFYNPKSGGGKAERFHLAREARTRGIEPVELHLGDDLEALVRDGDRQRRRRASAWPAETAPRRSSPRSLRSGDFHTFAFPAGTRNHFALDLGVDRDDVVGALDAFTEEASGWWISPRSTAACS